MFILLLAQLEIRLLCANFREDAEAPKAKLVKPNSISSSHSGSSRSGTSSTQSMMHNMGPQGQRVSLSAVAALKENYQEKLFLSSEGYNEASTKTPKVHSSTTSTSTSNSRSSTHPPELSHGNLTREGVTPVLIPGQTKAFQTV